MRISEPRSIAVFAGPSLPIVDRIEAPGLVYLPPASRGDVERTAREYDIVLLIDGVFHHDLAPSPKECYEATRHARMFGASSMGALRATECAPYGFLPLGIIARWYASDTIDGDDEVAVLAHPDTHYALSVPLVNVRYAGWIAFRRGILAAEERDELVEDARRVFYMDRTWDDVIERAPAGARESLQAIVDDGADLKRLDARFALRAVVRYGQRDGRERPCKTIPPAIRAPAAGRARDFAPIRLPAHVPKAPGTYDRAVPFDQTIALVPELRRRCGITRVADTTYLDRTGIPTFSALVPHSSDLIGVYNGKGLTREAAMASAVMEACERQIGASVTLRRFSESLSVVGRRIGLDTCSVRDDARDLITDCVLGTELLSGDEIAVPLAMVQCPWFGEKLFDATTTNGLASGNNLTEAIYHALCELIERHAWAIYHVRCSLAPRFFCGAQARDIALAPAIDLPAGDSGVDRLIETIRCNGLIVRAILLEERPLPPTVVATVIEPDSDPPMAHMGFGCSLSPSHALMRAITEAVQSRVADIQAAREDILRVDEPAGTMGDHARRIKALPTDQWYYDVPATSVTLASVEDRSSADLGRDLRCTLEALRACGFGSVVAVDISPGDLPISVVRAIVPGLETFMFTGKMGPRARAELNPFAVPCAS